MEELILFCRSLSRFIFSILKTKDGNEAQMCNQGFSRLEAEGEQSSPGSRSQMCSWAWVSTLLLSAASPLPCWELLDSTSPASSHLPICT